MKKVSLINRKRIGELPGGQSATPDKRDALIAMKLDRINQEAREAGNFQLLPLDLIDPDPNQPRKTFEEIASLAQSIRHNGIISPMIVMAVGERYRIVVGERRYRAAKHLSLDEVPCIIQSYDDTQIILLQLLENDQREGVSPLEEAEAVVRLLKEKGMTKTEVAEELGHDSAWVSMRLGLLEASKPVKELVQNRILLDIRTLHELRMLEKQFPEEAKPLIKQIREGTLKGAHRQVIANTRRVLRAKQDRSRIRMKEIVGLVLEDGILTMRTSDQATRQFTVKDGVLERFVAAHTQVEVV